MIEINCQSMVQVCFYCSVALVLKLLLVHYTCIKVKVIVRYGEGKGRRELGGEGGERQMEGQNFYFSSVIYFSAVKSCLEPLRV